jgi:hypothetical protein
MIKKIIVILAMIFTFPALAQEGTLLNDLALPLMDGLEENREAALLFDSPDGRIINAEAHGSLGAQEVNNFYRMVLPSLGWKMNVDKSNCDASAQYCLFANREQESLTLNVIENAAGLKVLFALSPN